LRSAEMDKLGAADFKLRNYPLTPCDGVDHLIVC
jgi:hypothetical protein